MRLLLEEQKNQIKHEFDEYKLSKDEYPIPYEGRKKQMAFCKFARKLIKIVCSSSKTSKKDFDSILVITNAKTTKTTLIDKLKQLNINETEKEELLKEAYELINEGINGYVGYPMSTVRKDLDINYIKSKLLEIIEEKDESKQKELIFNIDSENIKGLWPTYLSSWVHYINPKIFPIVALVNRKVLQSFGLDNDLKSYPKVIDMFKEILDLVGESDLGILDSFFYPQKFIGFTEEDFDNLKKIDEINKNPKYWIDNEYISKEKEGEAKEFANQVRKDFKNFSDSLNVKFKNSFSHDISRTRAQGMAYQPLFWLYYFKNTRGDKNSQAQLQVSIHTSKFYTAELWFEPAAKDDRIKLVDFLQKNPINFDNLRFRVYDGKKKEELYNIPAISTNIPRFINSLQDNILKLGIVSELGKESVIEIEDKIVEKCQEDLEFIYDNLYEPVFVSGVLAKKQSEIENLNDVQDLLITKKQLIFYGPPGTGKTYCTKKTASDILLK